MKKIILIFILFIGTACYGQSCTFSCSEPFDLSHGASRFMSNITGSNMIGEKIAKIILKKSIIQNSEDGKYKVDLDSYSVKDLKKGIFKKFTLKGKNVIVDGTKFSEIKLKTLCDFNYIDIRDPKKPIFKTDLPIEFRVVMTEDDINYSMQSNNYRRLISKINSSGFLKIKSDRIKISNNQFFYYISASVPFGSVTLIVNSDLKIRNGRIDFSNTRLVNESIYIDLKKLDWLINYINPLDYSLKVLENNHAELSVKNAEIKNDKIYADGWVVIPKN